jgi:hypothetical protein
VKGSEEVSNYIATPGVDMDISRESERQHYGRACSMFGVPSTRGFRLAAKTVFSVGMRSHRMNILT